MNSGIDELTAANNKMLEMLRDNGVINDAVVQESIGRHVSTACSVTTLTPRMCWGRSRCRKR
jgi:hypothetical protein